MNTMTYRPFGANPPVAVFDIKQVLFELTYKLPVGQVISNVYDNKIFSLWPLAENLVQVDFIFGNSDWIKFTHYSPGEHTSAWSGRTINLALFVLSNLTGRIPVTDKLGNTASVNWLLDLERGLTRSYRVTEAGGRRILKLLLTMWKPCFQIFLDSLEWAILMIPRPHWACCSTSHAACTSEYFGKAGWLDQTLPS